MSVDGHPQVVVVEDSRTYAGALKDALEHGGDIEVVGVYETAEDAIKAIPKVKPDLVTMDLELPGISGLEAVEHIMSASPLPILVLSAHVGAESQNAAAALAAGALDAVHKTELDLASPASDSAGELRRRVQLLSRIRVIRHPRGSLRPGLPSGPRRTASVIGICASTGGPSALGSILGALPGPYPVPILVVQHISPGFTDGLIRWLAEAVALPVARAEQRAPLAPGVWIAPDGAHLRLRRGRLNLDHKAPAGLHRPSADVLLSSLAAEAGPEAVGVVLTGMGKDGGEGTAAVRAAGGLTIAQDAPTSVVYGMPRAAADQGAELVLPLQEIAGHLLRLRHTPLSS